MSSLIVEACTIDNIEPHENADRLEIATVKGWRCIVPKDVYSIGDECVYLQPDILLPPELAEKLGVSNYLKKIPKNYPDRDNYAGRVSVTRLRGIPSSGIVARVYDEWREHLGDLATYLGVEKYEPPEPIGTGDAERDCTAFHRYIDMENIRNFPNVFEEDEIVIATEKIHGTNCRLGYVNENGIMTWMGGSHRVRRRQFTETDGKISTSVYWKPYDLYPEIQSMMMELAQRFGQPSSGLADIVVFGEIFGSGIQDLKYGQKMTQDFVGFDISVDGTYLNYSDCMSWFTQYYIPVVPFIYYGKYQLKVLEEHASGQTLLDDKHIREGIVIRPMEESYYHRGRKILKLINFDYLNRKGGTENH
jgi:RNA ligase (TIGR02306 family)